MQRQVQVQKEDGPTIRPYNWYPILGNCADGNLENADKIRFGENAAFKTAGRLSIKHAP